MEMQNTCLLVQRRDIVDEFPRIGAVRDTEWERELEASNQLVFEIQSFNHAEVFDNIFSHFEFEPTK